MAELSFPELCEGNHVGVPSALRFHLQQLHHADARENRAAHEACPCSDLDASRDGRDLCSDDAFPGASGLAHEVIEVPSYPARLPEAGHPPFLLRRGPCSARWRRAVTKAYTL